MSTRVPLVFLFTGFPRRSRDGKTAAYGDGELDIVRNTVVCTQVAPLVDPRWWCTDDKGELLDMVPPFRLRRSQHSLLQWMYFHVPPPDLLMYAWAARGKAWGKALGEFYKKQTGLPLYLQKVQKRQLRKPEPPPKDRKARDLDAAYRRWYGRQTESSKIFGYIIPRTRAITLLFSGKEFNQATVTLWPPRPRDKAGKQRKKATKPPSLTARAEFGTEGVVAATVHGHPDRLPSGVYAIKVKPEKLDPRHWSSRVRAQKGYTLKANVRFGITNLAGEFDAVVANPISVEEAVMIQFPLQYAHLVAAARKRETFPALKLKGPGEFAEFPDAMKPWSDGLGWTYDTAKLSVKLINADGTRKRGEILGKKIWGAIKPEDPTLKAIKDTIDFGFGLFKAKKNVKEAYDDLKQQILSKKALEQLNLSEEAWKTARDALRETEYWKAEEPFEHIRKNYRDRAVMAKLKGLGEQEREALLKAATPEEASKLEALIGKRASKAIGKGILFVDLAISVAEVGIAISSVVGSADKLDENRHSLGELARDYDRHCRGYAFRDGIGALEKLRTATVTGARDYDEKMAEAANKAVDTVLGVLALLPVVGKAFALLVAIKAAGELVVSGLTRFAAWIDEAVYDQTLSDMLGLNKVLTEVHEDAAANQRLLWQDGAEGGEKARHDLARQLRLRAEALNGLVALLTRAYTSFDHRGMSSKQIKATYLAKVQKYRVDLYVRLFMLRDGWELPLNPLIPLTLDQFWLMAFSSYIKDTSSLLEIFGFRSPLTRDALKQGPGMMIGAVIAGFHDDGIKASFQQSLPIQHLDARRVGDLAWALRTQFYALDKKCIDYTCVYHRPKGSKKDEDWKPINPGGNSDDALKPISPLEHVRVLVVLKRSVSPGIYPISLQLFRTTGVNLSGPVYKDIVRKLDDELLEDEAGFKGRLGCVFHPFYCLGPKVVPGVKPLADEHLEEGWAPLLFDRRSYSYAFEVRVGGKRTVEWVKLGGPKCQRSDLEDFPMSIDSKREDEKLLLEATFLRSRAKSFRFPRLFKTRKMPVPTGLTYHTKVLKCYGTGPLYIKYGSWRIQRASKGMTFDKHDWNTDVELVVVVWASEIEKERYRKLGQDWKKVPVQIQLINYEGSDKEGPELKSQLRYLGMLDVKSHRFSAEYKGPDDLKPAVTLLEDPLESQAIEGYIKKAGEDQPARCYLYGAHFKMTYRTPGGRKGKGIRPFASKLIDHDDYYRYSVINITTDADSGFSAEDIECPDGEIELHFRAPKSYEKNVPWAGEDSKEVKKWITELTTTNDPRVRLFKKDD
jgi:hypothetical protein